MNDDDSAKLSELVEKASKFFRSAKECLEILDYQFDEQDGGLIEITEFRAAIIAFGKLLKKYK